MAASAEEAVRNYLLSLRNPAALRNDAEIESLRERLDKSDDDLERLQLRQQILDAEQPPLERYEDAFVTHAKAYADGSGISDKAFAAEGVPPGVLRKAGFRNVGSGRGRNSTRSSGTRKRVSADEVRSSIPRKGTFTIKDVQDSSGASAAVVRRVVQEEVDGGNVKDAGPDPDHRGPGRAPTLYSR
jgi:hypothetical protein